MQQTLLIYTLTAQHYKETLGAYKQLQASFLNRESAWTGQQILSERFLAEFVEGIGGHSSQRQ